MSCQLGLNLFGMLTHAILIGNGFDTVPDQLTISFCQGISTIFENDFGCNPHWGNNFFNLWTTRG